MRGQVASRAMRTRPLVLLLPLAAAGLLTGCATKIDSGKAQDKISDAIKERAGVAPRSVDCPGGKTAKKGDTFSCQVVMPDGTKGSSLVTEKDAKGNVNFRVDAIARPIDTAKATKGIEQIVSRQAGIQVRAVTCPPKQPSRKGTTFTCHVSATDGTKGDVVVSIKDYLGNVHADAPFVHTHEAAAAITKDVKGKSDIKRFTVTCPEIVAGRKGTSYTCTADGDRGKATVVVTLSSDDGAFDYKVRSS